MIKFIKNIFFNKDKSIDFKFILASVIIIILIILKIDSCNNVNRNNEIKRQNDIALKNEISVEKNKSKKLQYSIAAYMSKMNKLEIYDKDLQEEVNNLKNRKPEVIIKTKIEYVHDTIFMSNILDSLGNGDYALNWHYLNGDSTREIVGKSKFSAKLNNGLIVINPGQTIISKDLLRLGLTVGVVYNKSTKLQEIFVTPDNMDVKITNLKGAILPPPAKKKYGVGISIGYGLGYIKTKNELNLGYGPYIGLSLTRNLLSF
jgi:hypothetical protein